MSDRMALRIAIDLMHVPSQVRFVRTDPLPDGVALLLRIAAGDNEAAHAAAKWMDLPRELVQQAAAFFIEQILFAPNADSYRVLGVNSNASAAELRHNVALLLKWLHPDQDALGEHSIFVSKVTAAWNNVKTPERRAAYDELRRSLTEKRKPRTDHRKHKSRWLRSTGNLPYRLRGGWHSARLYRSEKPGLLRRIWSLVFQEPL